MEVSIGPNELKKFRLVMGAILLLTVLTQLIDNAFMLITPILVENFSISTDVGSWVASIGGIGIAIGFLAFSSFADFFSEKKLLVIGLLLFCLPSITGTLFQGSYYMVVISRFVQAIGGISTSALYLVLIARYLPKKEQVIWMGLCTTSFTVSTVIGTVTGGYLSTYFGWQFIFYIPLIGLLALPIILKYLPNNPEIKSDLDFVGFLILAIFAICMNFLISNPSIILLIVTIALVVVFWVYISKARNPFVSIAFFKNRDYIITLAATFFYYLSQVALVFITPFLLQSLFDFSLEKVSLIYIIPYTVSGVIAAFSGTIINKFNMKRTLIAGVTLIIIGLVFGGFLSSLGIAYVLITLMLVNGGYALSFAPLLTRAISTLQESEVGTGIGLFNFTVRIANALGISITAFLLNSNFTEANVFNLSTQMAKYSNIFLVLAMTALIGITVYIMSCKKGNGGN